MARRVYHRGTYRDMTPEEEAARDAEEAAHAASLTPEAIAARLAAAKDAVIARLAASDAADRALAEGLFEVAKAARTGNWSAFVDPQDGSPVSNRAGFYRWLRARMG